MAYTQSDLDTIKAAILGGELSVRFSDGSGATYRSLNELIKIKNLIESELNAAETNPRQYPRHQLADFS